MIPSRKEKSISESKGVVCSGFGSVAGSYTQCKDKFNSIARMTHFRINRYVWPWDQERDCNRGDGQDDDFGPEKEIRIVGRVKMVRCVRPQVAVGVDKPSYG